MPYIVPGVKGESERLSGQDEALQRALDLLDGGAAPDDPFQRLIVEPLQRIADAFTKSSEIQMQLEADRDDAFNAVRYRMGELVDLFSPDQGDTILERLDARNIIDGLLRFSGALEQGIKLRVIVPHAETIALQQVLESGLEKLLQFSKLPQQDDTHYSLQRRIDAISYDDLEGVAASVLDVIKSWVKSDPLIRTVSFTLP
jgi:hypothetical protein